MKQWEKELCEDKVSRSNGRKRSKVNSLGNNFCHEVKYTVKCWGITDNPRSFVMSNIYCCRVRSWNNWQVSQHSSREICLKTVNWIIVQFRRETPKSQTNRNNALKEADWGRMGERETQKGKNGNNERDMEIVWWKIRWEWKRICCLLINKANHEYESWIIPTEFTRNY